MRDDEDDYCEYCPECDANICETYYCNTKCISEGSERCSRDNCGDCDADKRYCFLEVRTHHAIKVKTSMIKKHTARLGAACVMF